MLHKIVTGLTLTVFATPAIAQTYLNIYTSKTGQDSTWGRHYHTVLIDPGSIHKRDKLTYFNLKTCTVPESIRASCVPRAGLPPMTQAFDCASKKHYTMLAHISDTTKMPDGFWWTDYEIWKGVKGRSMKSDIPGMTYTEETALEKDAMLRFVCG